MNNSNYGDLNSNLLLVLNTITQNQNIAKLLYYEDKNINPLTRPDLDNPENLIMRNVFPIPVDPDTEDTENIIITVNFYTKPDTDPNNVDYQDVFMVFEIICHINNTLAKDLGSRTYAIAHEIDKIYNQKFIPELSSKNIKSLGIPPAYKVATNFYAQSCGYKLYKRISDRGC